MYYLASQVERGHAATEQAYLLPLLLIAEVAVSVLRSSINSMMTRDGVVERGGRGEAAETILSNT